MQRSPAGGGNLKPSRTPPVATMVPSSDLRAENND